MWEELVKHRKLHHIWTRPLFLFNLKSLKIFKLFHISLTFDKYSLKNIWLPSHYPLNFLTIWRHLSTSFFFIIKIMQKVKFVFKALLFNPFKDEFWRITSEKWRIQVSSLYCRIVLFNYAHPLHKSLTLFRLKSKTSSLSFSAHITFALKLMRTKSETTCF